jgi:hypothetical protein
VRRAIAAAIVVCAVVALPGCAGLPAGVDGDLTNGWPAMPQPKLSIPVAGTCYPGRYVGDTIVWVWSSLSEPVDCATTHYTETALVGTFTGADAQRSVAPDVDGPAMPAVYDQCHKGVESYLGGDPATALVSLQIQLPTNAEWRGGARWFRCDIVHLTDPFGTAWVDHGSIKGDLAGARTSAYGCLTTSEQADRTILNAKPVDCAAPHQAEFAGVFTAPNLPWPADQDARQKMADNGCQRVIATFLGYPGASQWANEAVGYWMLPWTQDRWVLGDRTTQCFAYAFTKSGTFVGSVKGIKNQTPKG